MWVEMTTPLNDSGARNYQFKLKLRGCLISMKSHEEMCCGEDWDPECSTVYWYGCTTEAVTVESKSINPQGSGVYLTYSFNTSAVFT